MLGMVVLIVAYYHGEIRAWYLSWHWRQIAVVVLDNCDPNFKGQGPHGDAIRFLTEDGTEKFVLAGLNNAESVGCNHRVVLDPDRFRVYVCEDVKQRVSAIDSSGKLLFASEIVDARAMAVDPQTGNLWCLVGRSFDKGEAMVLDLDGNHVATHPINGIDIAYSPYDQTFWAVGYPITKFDREGRILVQKPRKGWARVCVAPDPGDGGVWVAERDHPNVSGSVNRLLRLDRKGDLLHEVPLGIRDPFTVAYDSENRLVWVGGGNLLSRVSLDGDMLPPLAISARSITISATTGAVWVGTDREILRLNSNGEFDIRYSFPRGSSQSWLAAP